MFAPEFVNSVRISALIHYGDNAHDKGKADDPIKYFAAKENQDLGVIKALRKAPKLS